MKSIICNHFSAPENYVSSLEAALARLGQYIDAEQETLGRVLAQSSRWQATSSLNRIMQLHLAPDGGPVELRELLEEAQFALEYILETLRGISCNQTTVSAWGLSGPASFDVHLRWSAARLQEIVGTLRWALASLS